MTRLLLLTLALIVYGSLFPWTFQDVPREEGLLWTLLHGWPHGFSRDIFFDISLNIVLYVPVGIFGFLAYTRRWSATKAALVTAIIGMLSSAAIEAAQYYLPVRDTSLSDVVLNTSGTMLGILIGWLIIHHKLPHWGEAVFARPDAWILLGCWTAYQLLPLTPSFSRAGWRLNISVPHALNLAAASTALLYFAETLAVITVLEAITGPLRTSRRGQIAFAGAIGVVCCKMLLAERVLSVSEVVAVAAAGMAALAVPFRRFAWILLLAIGFSGLLPFHPQAPGPFNWVPFLATLNADWMLSIAVLMGKVFRYGATVWLLNRAGWRWVPAMCVTVGVLAAIEFVQRYLPGHVAEITDPFVAICMAFVLWSVRDAFAGYARA